MPGLDGFKTCKRLKEMEETRSIPVFFFTAPRDGTIHSGAESAVAG
ncbi:MAG: response regulator PleD [Candidatus Omnitrophica bacterium ADurb.Bin277]|nr:MAG: response regulator PleD [Candidatus Omnitrophica bacterium ADurb.Bin277]